MRFFLFALLLFLYPGIRAENTNETSNVGFSFKPHIGFVIVHSRELAFVKESLPKGFMLETYRYNTGADVYDHCLCSAKTGISFAFWDYDNPTILGRSADLSLFLEPVFRINKSMNFSIRGAAGLSYLSNPYDSVNNPYNLSYSTKVSFNLSVGIQLNHALSRQTQLQFGTYFNHISNGGIKEPNKGINFPTFSIGMTYVLQTPYYERNTLSVSSQRSEQSDRLSLHFSGSNKQVEMKRYYPIAGMAIQYMNAVSSLNGIGIEFEWLWHGANYHIAELNNLKGNALSFSSAIGNELYLGRFYFQQYFGVYLKKSAAEKRDVFQRYSLFYRAGKHLMPGIGLRVHGHVADFLDLRLGYNF